MLSSAKISKKSDDNHIVVISYQGTLFGLFDTEYKHREEDVLGSDVVGSSDGFFTNVES